MMPAFVIVAAELAGGSAAIPDAGFKKLAELRPAKLTVFWTDWAPLNKSGDVTLGTEFDYYLEAMKNQKYPINYVIPKEKGFGASEYVSIVKGTKNQELAEEFLNQMIEAEGTARLRRRDLPGADQHQGQPHRARKQNAALAARGSTNCASSIRCVRRQSRGMDRAT